MCDAYQQKDWFEELLRVLLKREKASEALDLRAYQVVDRALAHIAQNQKGRG